MSKHSSGMTSEEDLTGISELGKGATQPSRNLETFPNHHSDRGYTVTLTTDDFTCLCPATGQPDFATLTIRYIPDQKVVESKSLKLYFWSFRDKGVFHEHIANVILDDLVKALDPYWCEVVADFGVRGGIAISVTASHFRPDSPYEAPQQ